MKLKRQFLLLCASLLTLAVFFLLPQNCEWLNSKVLAYGADLTRQVNHTDPEFRKESRWEAEYTLSRSIASLFKKKGIADSVLVLIPPTSYFKAYGIDYHVPEPAVFYYYTGLKTVWANSPQASSANWMVTLENGRPRPDHVTDKKALADTIASFLKYGVSL